jgi:putative membrane protein
MFVDTLAFQQVTLLIAAVMVCYVGVAAALAMRRNDAAGVRSALRSGAIPLGSVGAIATLIAIWGEIAWPLPGSYNILFTDVYMLFGVTLVVLAVSMAASARLQFAGLFALVSGGVTIAYGWAGYGLNMTKDPFETFLLYGAFGLAGILAFPTTLFVDHFLAHPESTIFAAKTATAHSRPAFAGASRAVQPVVPGAPYANDGPASTVAPRFRVPIYINTALVIFLVMMALAALAALLYLNTTVPAHLASAP